MPQSRNRAKHHHHPSVPTQHHNPPAARRSAAFVVSVLAAILGLAVALVTQGADVLWLFIGTAAGAIIGYIIGREMDKSIVKTIGKR